MGADKCPQCGCKEDAPAAEENGKKCHDTTWKDEDGLSCADFGEMENLCDGEFPTSTSDAAYILDMGADKCPQCGCKEDAPAAEENGKKCHDTTWKDEDGLSCADFGEMENL